MKKAKPLFSGIIAFGGIFVLLCCFMILSCRQDSVFYYISREETPKKPIVDGSPTNIIVIDDTVFAGSRMGKKIFYYRGVWNSINTPDLGDGKPLSLIELAEAGGYLYALLNDGNSFSPSSTVIKRIAKNEIGPGKWQDVAKDSDAGNYTIESIYGTGNDIFAGGRSVNNVYAVLHIGHDPLAVGELKVVKDDFGAPALLNGAAADGSGNIFLATGAGIYKIDNAHTADSDSIAVALAGTNPVEGTFKETDGKVVNDNMAGILAVTDNNDEVTITAVSRDTSGSGTIHIYDSAENKFQRISAGVGLSGAMCVWKKYDSVADTWKPALLLLGVSDFGTVHGYRELVLIDGKPTDKSEIKSPDKNKDEDTGPCSIRDKTKYAANIGKYSIRAILQLPDSVEPYQNNTEWEPTIFAATYIKGLWSYKFRDEWGWNAED